MKETRFRLKNQIIDKLNKKDFNDLDLLIIDYFTECLVEKYSSISIHKDKKTIEFKLTRNGTISNEVILCLRIEQNKIQNENDPELYKLSENINIWITFNIPDCQFNTCYMTLDMLLRDNFDLSRYLEVRYEDMFDSIGQEITPTLYARMS